MPMRSNSPFLSTRHAPSVKLGHPLALVGLVAAYYVASSAGLFIGETSPLADVIWPSNGLLLAVLLLSPRSRWIPLLSAGLLASVLVHLTFQYRLTITFVASFANMMEVAIAAVIMRLHDAPKPDLTRPRTVFRFVTSCVILAPLCSAAFVSIASGGIFQHGIAMSFYNWFMGDALGIAIVTPMILAIQPDEIKSLLTRARRVETITLLLGFTLFICAVFVQSTYPISFLIFPVLLLLIFRLGLSGASLGVFIVAILSALFTAKGRGPFALVDIDTESHRAILLQFFLGVLLVTVYAVSAALTERDQLQEELAAAYREANGLAGRDHLTGLANRRTFDQEFLREWRRAARDRSCLSLVMIDVDHFKSYNDRFGHLAGDECLRTIATVLKNNLYRTTDIAARFGGEEFAIILPASHAEGVLIMARRLRTAIAALSLYHPDSVFGVVTISAGVSTFCPTQSGSFHDAERLKMVEGADSALYIAKAGGRNRVEAWDNENKDLPDSRS